MKEFESPTDGIFSVIKTKGKKEYTIWWDFFDENDGCCLGNYMEDYVGDDGIFKDATCKDFSDLPKDGIFKTEDDAISYLHSKFENLTEL